MNTDAKAERKWVCDYCTYENWAASKRCVLCRALRQPQFISDIAANNSQESIYSLAGYSDSKHTSETSRSSCESTSSSKWVCQACTYLNWSKSTKCTQCLTPRPKVITVISNTQNQGLSVNVVNSKSTDVEGTVHKEMPQASNNDKNKSVASSASGGASSSQASPASSPDSCKWICTACTYENWPKSLKCVICQALKEQLLHDKSSDKEVISKRYNRNVSVGEPSRINNLEQRNMAAESAAASSSSLPDSSQCAGASCSNSLNQDNEKGLQENNKNNEIQAYTGTKSSNIFAIRGNCMDQYIQLWLGACQGVVRGDYTMVEAYLAASSDVNRILTAEECAILNRPSAFKPGYSLIHLAIKFQREDLLPLLLSASDKASKTKAKKRVFCHISPAMASAIIREVCLSIRQRKGDFACSFLIDISTFFLPAEMNTFPARIKEQLLSEIIDEHVQKELEVEELVINWSMEVTTRLGSRLYALWNRNSGDCLLDSVLQASWGVFDRDNTIRRCLADSLAEGARFFYTRWKETESRQAATMQYSLDEAQWEQDWTALLTIARQPGSSLEQVHIFALTHILRRPIIVYGIKFVKSFRGDNLGLARFQGVYLPLFWEPSFCWKCPIALGYTRGHFTALVAQELGPSTGSIASLHESHEEEQITFMPLMDCHGQILPIHFLSPSQIGKDECILRQWLDCCVTDGGLLVAKQRQPKQPLLVQQMVDEWLDRFRRLCHVFQKEKPAKQDNNKDGVSVRAKSEDIDDD